MEPHAFQNGFPLRDLGCTTNVDVLTGFLSVDACSLLDIGCGGMVFTRLLASLGATVLGIDPDSVQAEKNRRMDLPENIRFEEAGADQLPAADDSLDGVCFAYSLHHIPAHSYPRVFAEVFRVLKPGGFLYVIEPTNCPQNDVMKLYYNEDHERELAWTALHELAIPRFDSADAVTYHSFAAYESWEDYAGQYANRSYNSSYSAEDVWRPEVKAAFEHHATEDMTLRSEKRVMFLRGLN